MKKKYILLMTALTISCVVTLSGCDTKATENPAVSSIQEKSNEEEKGEKVEVNTSDINDNVDEVEETSEDEGYDDVEKIVKSGYEDVEAFLDEEYANKRFQGVALVAQGDEIKFAKAYGYADYDENRENKLTTRFAIASNTKQFTAAAIMQLVEEKKINLDDTIDKYFPKYQYANKITVKQLLQMRSGIPDYLNEIDLFMKSEECLSILKDYENDAYFDKYVEDERWSEDTILKSLYLTDLCFEPGECYDYCNTNYYLLGLIIEQASGLSYEEYVEQNIFKPCKMITSSMKTVESDAKGHGSDVSGEIEANPDFTYAAGNIYANVYDMFRWNRMLHKGNILSKESYEQMITPVDGYGYGLFINDGIIRHSGVIDGFNSNTEYNPKNDITIIVMENSDETTDILDAKYDTSIIREMINN